MRMPTDLLRLYIIEVVEVYSLIKDVSGRAFIRLN